MFSRKEKRPGIRQVAEESGYSITTVSMALNGGGRVNQDTRRRIAAIAKRLGYVPNAAGKALKNQRSETVGLLFYPACAELFSNAFYVPVLDGIEEVLSQQGHNLLIAGSRCAPDEVALPKCVLENAVDGMILLGRVSTAYATAIQEKGVPVVAIDERHEGAGVDTICSDGVNGARTAVRYLLQLGHRRIAMLAAGESTTGADDRCAGYRAALEEAGLGYHEDYVFRGTFDNTGMMEAAERFLEAAPPVTALVAVNDSAALSALAVFARRGVRVPDDLSLVGFDDIEAAQHAVPPLTTMAIDKAAMGRLGAETLLARIDDPARPPVNLTAPVTLLERASAACITQPERICT